MAVKEMPSIKLYNRRPDTDKALNICADTIMVFLLNVSAIYPAIGANNVLGKMLHMRFIAKFVADPVAEMM